MISYCTTCKGRLWQLELTLPKNVKSLIPGEVELIILDYHSADPVREYLRVVHADAIADGRIKYYRLTQDLPFDASHAKNVAHLLATGDALFNLDADNYIGCTVKELESLKVNEMLIRPTLNGWVDDGRSGRIGLHRKAFDFLRGYDEHNLKGMGTQDADLMTRAQFNAMRLKPSKDVTYPIQQPLSAKLENVDDPNSYSKNSKYRYVHHYVNPNGYGFADLVDFNGLPISTGVV